MNKVKAKRPKPRRRSLPIAWDEGELIHLKTSNGNPPQTAPPITIDTAYLRALNAQSNPPPAV